MKQFIILLILISPSIAIAHPFQKWEQIQNFHKSGFTKCSVYSENILREIWVKNTKNRSVQIMNVSNAVEMAYGPKYDENYFIFSETTYYLGTENRVDSSSLVQYSGKISSDSSNIEFNSSKRFSIFLYDNYKPLKLIFKKNYNLIDNQKVFFNYDFYEYDFDGKLLSWTDQLFLSENIKINCVVNEFGQIVESETEEGSFCLKYFYNDAGQLNMSQSSRHYPSKCVNC